MLRSKSQQQVKQQVKGAVSRAGSPFSSTFAAEPAVDEVEDVVLESAATGGSRLEALCKSYKTAKTRARELQTTGGKSAIPLKMHAQHASRVYTAVTALLYSSIGVAKAEELERYIRKQSVQLPGSIFDLPEWQEVMDLARDCRLESALRGRAEAAVVGERGEAALDVDAQEEMIRQHMAALLEKLEMVTPPPQPALPTLEDREEGAGAGAGAGALSYLREQAEWHRKEVLVLRETAATQATRIAQLIIAEGENKLAVLELDSLRASVAQQSELQRQFKQLTEELERVRKDCVAAAAAASKAAASAAASLRATDSAVTSAGAHGASRHSQALADLDLLVADQRAALDRARHQLAEAREENETLRARGGGGGAPSPPVDALERQLAQAHKDLVASRARLAAQGLWQDLAAWVRVATDERPSAGDHAKAAGMKGGDGGQGGEGLLAALSKERDSLLSTMTSIQAKAAQQEQRQEQQRVEAEAQRAALEAEVVSLGVAAAQAKAEAEEGKTKAAALSAKLSAAQLEAEAAREFLLKVAAPAPSHGGAASSPSAAAAAAAQAQAQQVAALAALLEAERQQSASLRAECEALRTEAEASERARAEAARQGSSFADEAETLRQALSSSESARAELLTVATARQADLTATNAKAATAAADAAAAKAELAALGSRIESETSTGETENRRLLAQLQAANARTRTVEAEAEAIRRRLKRIEDDASSPASASVSASAQSPVDEGLQGLLDGRPGARLVAAQSYRAAASPMLASPFGTPRSSSTERSPQSQKRWLGLIYSTSAVQMQRVVRGFLARARVYGMAVQRSAASCDLLAALRGSGTRQGQTGWYEEGGEVYYFVRHEGQYLLLGGPLTTDMYALAAAECRQAWGAQYHRLRSQKNVCIDLLGLHATRMQLEMLTSELRQRDEHIRELMSRLGIE